MPILYFQQFLVIKLHSDQEAFDLPAIKDPDPLIPCKLMEDRENFLNLARDNNFEFSSLRRAKFSSTALLFELHNWQKERCNYCNQVLGKTFLKCEFCSVSNVLTIYEGRSICNENSPVYPKVLHLHAL